MCVQHGTKETLLNYDNGPDPNQEHDCTDGTNTYQEENNSSSHSNGRDQINRTPQQEN